MTRVGISKGLRFKIFHRDGFVCQYCGRRPPDVVLEIDHVRPRAHGGDNDELNLLTACDECNRGKSAKLLTEVRPKPDADLEFLRIQQETAEVHRFLLAKQEHAKIEDAVIMALIGTWRTFIEYGQNCIPNDLVFKRWFEQYSPEDIEYAIRVTGGRGRAGKVTGGKTGMIQYVSAILRNRRREVEVDS